jgi:hypothetical protein
VALQHRFRRLCIGEARQELRGGGARNISYTKSGREQEAKGFVMGGD